MDVVGGHDGNAGASGQGGQGVVAGPVERVAVVPQLDQHPVLPEGVDEPVEFPLGGGGATVDQRLGHRPLAAAGEHEPGIVMATGFRAEVDGRTAGLGQLLQAEPGLTLAPPHLGFTGRPGQPGVPDSALGQHDEMLPLGIGDAGLPDHPGRRPRRAERQLGAEHGGQAELPGDPREPDGAVEPVMVGDRQPAEPEPGRLGDEILRMARPVQKGEVGVAMELGIARLSRLRLYAGGPPREPAAESSAPATARSSPAAAQARPATPTQLAFHFRRIPVKGRQFRRLPNRRSISGDIR